MPTRSKSSLTNITRISPNSYKGRNGKTIRRLTPHCVAGNASVETIGAIFAPSSRKASCNYGIGSDGRIIQVVDEPNTSWCSSSAVNDREAITFEISNDSAGPNWHMSDKALESWVNLSVDIAKFYGFSKVAYYGSLAATTVNLGKPGEMVITIHQWFKNKACPGPYFISQLPRLVNEINAKLADSSTEQFKATIQNAVQFSDPQYIWDILDKHPYAVSLYEKFANAVSKPGIREQYKTIIQAKCAFSDPLDVWKVLDTHPYPDDFYRKLAAVVASK